MAVTAPPEAVWVNFDNNVAKWVSRDVPPTSQQQGASTAPTHTQQEWYVRQPESTRTSISKLPPPSIHARKKAASSASAGLPPSSPQTLRFVCISDTHGRHRAFSELPPGDVLVHSGDLLYCSSLYDAADGLDILRDFNDWIGTVGRHFRHRLVIGGNHDKVLEDLGLEGARRILSNCTFLLNECYDISTFTDARGEVVECGVRWNPSTGETHVFPTVRAHGEQEEFDDGDDVAALRSSSLVRREFLDVNEGVMATERVRFRIYATPYSHGASCNPAYQPRREETWPRTVWFPTAEMLRLPAAYHQPSPSNSSTGNPPQRQQQHRVVGFRRPEHPVVDLAMTHITTRDKYVQRFVSEVPCRVHVGGHFHSDFGAYSQVACNLLKFEETVPSSSSTTEGGVPKKTKALLDFSTLHVIACSLNGRYLPTNAPICFDLKSWSSH